MIDYFDIKAISNSQINLLFQSKAKFWENCVFNPKRKPFPETADLIFGKLMHCMLFEPENFDIQFLKLDKVPRKGSSAYKDVINIAGKRNLVSGDDVKRANSMIDFLMKDKIASSVLRSGSHESPLVWVDEKTGLKLKAKIDSIRQTKSGVEVIDYKTTRSLADFSKKASEYGYHRQAQFYKKAVEESLGLTVDAFTFVVQEKEYPQNIALMRFDNEDCVFTGKREIEDALDYIAKGMSLETDRERFSYFVDSKTQREDGTVNIQTVIIPNWYYHKNYGGI